MRKIDVHIHASSAQNAEETLADLARQGVERAILMSMSEEDDARCRELCARDSRLRWCCYAGVQEPEAVYDRLARCKEQGAVGVGELAINARMDSPALRAVFDAAQRLDMPVLFHMSPEVGFSYGVVDEPGLPLLEKTLADYPALKLVGHSQPFWMEISGDAPVDRERRNGRGEGPVTPGGRVPRLLERYPNLYADLSAGSGYCALVRDEAFALAFIERFQDQLLFGTDTVDAHSPWRAPLAKWLEDKYAAGLISERAMRKICHENAGKLYGALAPRREDTVVTDTPCGPVRGLREGERLAYLGIPYAHARRFDYPQVTTSWAGTLEATAFGPCCWQFRAFSSEALGEDPFYYNEFRRDIRFTYGDDCQRLNIWTPARRAEGPLPVIVFIHGGAFLGGSSGERHLAAPAWTREDVIAVTVNYRLGPFGFLCTSEGLREAGHCGNYGLYDLLAALRWVRENIAAFGGDPERVTLMGQSAGCMCAQMLCISPLARGLFHRAVLCSGAGLSPTFDSHASMRDNLAFGDAVMRALGCTTLDELRACRPKRILDAFGQELRRAGCGLSVTSPVIDGELIPCGIGEAIRGGQLHAIPYMMSSTSEDLWQPELFGAILRWQDAAGAAGAGPCYAAYFSRQLPGDARGAFHSADLWYWFGTIGRSWRPIAPWDEALSRAMCACLTAFARTGDPNAEGVPAWRAHGEAADEVMVFGDGEIGPRRARDIIGQEE